MEDGKNMKDVEEVRSCKQSTFNVKLYKKKSDTMLKPLELKRTLIKKEKEEETNVMIK